MKTDFYVYAHRDQQGQIRYIGKGRLARAWTLCQRSKRWGLAFPDRNPIVEILAHDLSDLQAFQRECEEISKALSSGADLANVAAGGAGGDSWDQRAVEILSESRRGENAPWFGKERGDFMKKLKSIQMEKCPQPRLGCKLSPEHTAAFQAKSHTPESVAKRSAALRSRKQSPELIERRIAPLRGRIMSADHRSAISAGKKGRPNGLAGRTMPEEHRRKISEARLNSDAVKASGSKIHATRRANGTDRGWTTSKAKAVLCVETGETFRCAKDAAAAKGMKFDKHIQACCTGRKPSAGGFTWKYA